VASYPWVELFARSKKKQKSCYLTGMKGIKRIGQKLFTAESQGAQWVNEDKTFFAADNI